MKKLIVGLVLVVVLAVNASGTVTPFSGPLTNAILSVDLNGGKTTDLKPTEGLGAADAYGVVWTPWGGADGIQLPQNQEGVLSGTSSLSKQFGTTSVIISASGTLVNYDTANPITSRDRGLGDTSDGYMFSDFIFGKKSGSNVQGTNYLQVEFDGLMAGGQYQVALYSYDSTYETSVNWTSTAPVLQNTWMGWWSDKCSDDGYSNIFQAPTNLQTITWGLEGDKPAPALLSLTADAGGKIFVYGFGGSGISGDQNAQNSYLNGFQISMLSMPVPEPATIALLGLGLVVFKKRK